MWPSRADAVDGRRKTVTVTRGRYELIPKTATAARVLDELCGAEDDGCVAWTRLAV